MPTSIICELELNKRAILIYLSKKLQPSDLCFSVNTEFLYNYLESSDLNKDDKIRLIVNNIVFNVLFSAKKDDFYFENSFSINDFKDDQLSTKLFNIFSSLDDNQIDSLLNNYILNIRNSLFNFVVSIKNKYLDYLSIKYFIISGIIAAIIYITYLFLS
jgi:hypothetical protein